MARTQEERKAETRSRLLAAAAGLFAEHGIDAVSVDAVADAAERTSGALYAHFGSKQGLLLALLDEWKHSLVTVIAAEFELSTGVEDRLRAVATNVIAEPSEETRRLLLLEQELWLRAARDTAVADALGARLRESQDRMTRGLASWMADGVIPDTTAPDTLATAFRAVVLGLVLQRRVDPAAVDASAAEHALGAVLGVGAPVRPRS